MTNFDYIMSKMTERNFADIFCNGSLHFNKEKFGKKIYTAFKNWQMSLSKTQNYSFENYSFSLLNEDKIPNVFFSRLVYNKDTGNWEDIGRKDNLSFQVWLSKQYNPEEWSDN